MVVGDIEFHVEKCQNICDSFTLGLFLLDMEYHIWQLVTNDMKAIA